MAIKNSKNNLTKNHSKRQTAFSDDEQTLYYLSPLDVQFMYPWSRHDDESLDDNHNEVLVDLNKNKKQRNRFTGSVV